MNVMLCGNDRSLRRKTLSTVGSHINAPRRAVEHLLFLESRPVRRGVGNLMSAGAGGWVRFWECHAEGELIAQFNAGHRPGASVTAMCTDHQNFHYVITGDTDGYIKVWYIPRYADAAAGDDQPATPPHAERFQLLRESMIMRLLTVQQGRFAPPSAASDPDVTWTAPPLITAFHGHLNVVTSLDYVDSRDCFLSASDDCSVRMWTIYGAFVGIFGQETPWLPIEPPPQPLPELVVHTSDTAEVTGGVEDLSLSADTRRTSDGNADGTAPVRRSTVKPSRTSEVGEGARPWRPRRVPADVRRVASACSLRVMYGGHVPQWKSTKAKLLAYVEVYQRIVHIQKQRKKITDDAVDRPADVLRQLSDLPSVEHSRILGGSYKRQRHYRPLPPVPRVLQTDVKVSV